MTFFLSVNSCDKEKIMDVSLALFLIVCLTSSLTINFRTFVSIFFFVYLNIMHCQKTKWRIKGSKYVKWKKYFFLSFLPLKHFLTPIPLQTRKELILWVMTPVINWDKDKKRERERCQILTISSKTYCLERSCSMSNGKQIPFQFIQPLHLSNIFNTHSSHDFRFIQLLGQSVTLKGHVKIMSHMLLVYHNWQLTTVLRLDIKSCFVNNVFTFTWIIRHWTSDKSYNQI